MVKNIAITSLSRGILGEKFIKFEKDIGLKRLEEMGLNVSFTENALKGLDYINGHPEKRAEDLISSLKDRNIDTILCAIGGEDTYRLLPFLFENNELSEAVKDNNKIFLGYSDTTMNHLMLYKAGLNTFYGQSFLSDICELEDDMLPYTKKYFTELIQTGRIKEIKPSPVWYESRKAFSEDQIGTKLVSHKAKGFELLQGKDIFHGKILGGCIDTLFDIFDGTRFSDSPLLCKKYSLFPSLEDWRGKILLLESSEEKATPEKYTRMIRTLKDTGIFNVISGVIVGRPADEMYAEEYKKILLTETGNKELPIVFNINIGHSMPRCIIPFGIDAEVSVKEQRITFNY